MKPALRVKPALLGAAFAAFAAVSLPACLPARADDSINYDNTNFSGADSSAASSNDADYPYEGQSGFVVSGSIRRVDGGSSRFTVFSDNGRRYNVDDYNANIRLNGQAADSTDLREGMRVLVAGRLLGVAFVKAAQVRVLPPASDSALAPVAPAPSFVPTPAAPVAPLDEAPSTMPVPAAPAVVGTPVTLDAVVTGADADGRHVDLLDAHDNRVTADTLGTDIILPEADHAGQLADLVRGLHVHVIGTQTPDGSIQADRIRVIPADEQAAPAALPADAAPVDPNPAPSVAVDVDLSQYTGILIDARGLPGIERSMSPNIVGPDGGLLYPDRSHVPTPDEVQDESIVRYYHSLDDAEQGVVGAHPLILTAAAMVGPGSDGVQLSASDADLLQQLDKRLRFSRTWKVGFLIPANQ